MRVRLTTLGAFAVSGATVVGLGRTGPGVSRTQMPVQARARAAIERSVPLLQSSAQTWIEKRTCPSRHHQALGTLAVLFAAQRGFKIDRNLLAAQIDRVTLRTRESVLQWDAGINAQIAQPYLLVALAAAGAAPRRELSDARIHYLAGKQSHDGHWRSESHRPPLEDSEFTATALCLRALQLYAPPARAAEFRDRVARARRWLEAAEPRTNEERTMQLLGLAWAGSDIHAREVLASKLIAEQRADGGWAQIPNLGSDAYATGKTLFVLQQTGSLRVDDRAFRRGVNFLLDTQEAGGAWHQTTRRKGPGLPYFETGFPYGEDQFISFAGSAWATMALSLVVDSSQTALVETRVVRDEPPSASSAMGDGVTSLMDAAISGSIDDMQAALAAGADVNARSTTGVTALMCAVASLAKSALLVSRGANVNAATASGVTPLMLAASYDGALETMKLLLEHGADANAVTRDGVSALHGAAASGDPAKIALLVGRGVEIDPKEKSSGITPLHDATLLGDAATVHLLLAHGANPNTPIAQFGNTTALIEASFAGFPDVVKTLIAGGANLNARDDDGRTALMYAVWRDPGYTDAVRLLLQAGADRRIKAHDGATALDVAERSHYTQFATLLRDTQDR